MSKTTSNDPRVDFLTHISSLIDSVDDPDRLLDLIVTTAVKIMNAKAGSLLILNPESEKLFFHTATGDKTDELKQLELKKDEGIAGWVFKHKTPLVVPDVAKDERWNKQISAKIGVTINSIAAAPLMTDGEVIGVLEIIDMLDNHSINKEDMDLISVLSDLAATAIKKSRIMDEYSKENTLLRKELESRYYIVGESHKIKDVLADAKKVAVSKSTTLICGESGTGKELVARSIHNQSPRRKKPFMAVNCGVFPESLLESVLFGHEKGSFTGADAKKIGLFEAAHEGTLFLDEIGETTPVMQVKLLRVLQENSFYRVGGTDLVSVDVRIIAATNKDITAMVEKGEFREDLFYRLHVVRIDIPPLRERTEDIPLLVEFFLAKKCQEFGKPILKVTPEAMKAMKQYNWPGNIRELENAIERAIVMGSGEEIEREHLPFDLTKPGNIPKPEPGQTLKDGMNAFKKEFVLNTLQYAGGNKNKAAAILGIQRTYLYRLFAELGIEA